MWKSGGEVVLFVGGPYNGRRVSIPSEDRIVHVSKPRAYDTAIQMQTVAEVKMETVSYYIHTLRDAGGEYRVALPNGENNPIGKLVEKYPKHRRKR